MPDSARGAAGARVLVALVGGQLGVHAAMAGLRLAAPLQALREGYSAWAVGVLLALFAIAPVLLALPAGRMADRLGYHRPVYLAVLLTMAGGLLAVLSTVVSGALHFGLLCAAAVLVGAGANLGLLTIQRTAGLAAADSTERVRIFSWLGVAPALANVLGPVAVGLLIDGFNFRMAYLFLLLLPLATLVSARYVPRLLPPGAEPIAQHTNWESRGQRASAESRGQRASAESHRQRASAWALLHTPGFKRLLVVNWLLSMCWDVHLFAVPVLGHERGFNAATIGLILGSFTLSVTAVRLVIPLLAHRLSELQVLRGAMLGTGAVFALYPLAPNPWLMGLCALLLGLTLGSVQPMVMSMLHHLTPDNRHGEALALRSMVMNLSSTLMPLLFGATGAVVGAALLFWVVGGAVGSGAWVARRLRAPGL
ncbi:MAG: MFS transporter [Rubrivivax sp.]|nr:MFS transporter [Rubrivivax sp.]